MTKNLMPPQKDIATKTHEAFREMLKAYTLGFVNPLVDFILPSFHQQRLEKWYNEIALAIEVLQETKLTKEDLLKDEEFVSLLKETIMIGAKTHQQEKHKLLQNALFNHFESQKSFDEKIIFTRLIDSLTLYHFNLLVLIHNYQAKLQEYDKFSEILKLLKSDSLSNNIPEYQYKPLLSDLEKFQLIEIGDIEFEEIVKKAELYSSGSEDKSLPYITITRFGNEFLNYIMLC